MVLLITYDLNTPGKDYKDLYAGIKAIGDWAHPVESVYFVQTFQSVATISSQLLKLIDNNDRLFVVDITGKDRQGWLSQEMWNWLNSHY